MPAGNSVFNEAHDHSSAHACLVHNSTDVERFMALVTFCNDIDYFPQLRTAVRQLRPRSVAQRFFLQILQLL